MFCVAGDGYVMSMHLEQVLEGVSGSFRETLSQLNNGPSPHFNGQLAWLVTTAGNEWGTESGEGQRKQGKLHEFWSAAD